MEANLIRRGLEELIKSIDLELARTEVRLTMIAEKFGLKSWKELEEFFKRGVDNLEIDLAWVEYRYLKDKYESLLKDREKVLQLLSSNSKS
ncbi:MAG: hypothetical protein MRT15_05990 [archaeon YNP-LCB-003-016]|uniref:hypothetical protein n=1 Tax=Candidatus Culexarchaeum yellowstonense TaxID=2928963 RepID=UPI0026EACA19|nr:hypothetical protein [Candidatus Culexarchaeum yellowstonense]MCR6691919.1 hypothetical protein [Candidatus Culexarchaeum yellowstonense]